jgi:predicted nuclease with TOPRIM domain
MCQNCVKSIKILQQFDFSNSATAPPSNDNGSHSTDLKHILSCLDYARTEQSKLFDLINNQSKKLDLLNSKFTRVLTELSELKEENKILRNNVDSLVDRVVSLEKKQLNLVSNDDAF